MTTAPAGLIPILATPFTDDGDLDRASLCRLVEFELAAGADGLAVFGMASEGFTLTADERPAILRDVRSVVGADVPVVAGVNATGTRIAVDLVRAAADDGADQVMVLPPYLVRPTPDQTVEFFARVAAEGGLPVMVQDAPGVTGVTMDRTTIGALADLDGVVSIKVESPPTPHRIAAVGDLGLTVLGGQNAQALIEEYDNGAVGTMPACEFTDLLRPILDDLTAGRRDDARARMTALLPLIHLGVRPSQAWAVHKHVLLRRGIISSAQVRLPAQTLNPVTRRALDEVLDELDLPAWPFAPAGARA